MSKSKLTEAEYVSRMARAIRAMEQEWPMVNVGFRWVNFVQVIGALQLALRHPQLPPNVRADLRSFIDAFLEKVETIQPELAQLIRMGDAPECDLS